MRKNSYEKHLEWREMKEEIRYLYVSPKEIGLDEWLGYEKQEVNT
jgi:hypothetical protein